MEPKLLFSSETGSSFNQNCCIFYGILVLMEPRLSCGVEHMICIESEKLGRQTWSTSMPRSVSPTISTSPFIRGFHVTSWMSSLINQQDGCLRIVPHQARRLMQEQLAQTVARNAPSISSTSDQVQYLCAQLAHRDAQLEHVRSERDTHFVQEEELLAHMRLLSSEAKDWKSRVVGEAEQVLCSR